jgi:hypothetical protein
VIKNNTGYDYGGAMYVGTNGLKIIKGNKIINNTGNMGGAIWVWRGGLKVIIENNFISQNYALMGGGIYSTADASEQINQNMIVNNTAKSHET